MISNHDPKIDLSAEVRSSSTKPPISNHKNTSKDKKHSTLNWLCLLLSSAALAISLVLYYQQNHLKDYQNTTVTNLDKITNSIEKLGIEINDSNNHINKISAQTKAMIDESNLEIRKLWDLSNKRNRPEIKANTNQLANLETKQTDLLKKINNTNNSISELKDQINILQDALKKTIKQQLDSNQQTDQLNAIKQSIDNIQTKTNLLTTQQTSNEKALDTYRAQINKRLLQLENAWRATQPTPEKS